MDYSPGQSALRTIPALHCAVVAHTASTLVVFFFFYIKDRAMTFSLSIGPLVSLIAGILILVMPRLLSTIVALYLIIMGILGLLGMHNLRF